MATRLATSAQREAASLATLARRGWVYYICARTDSSGRDYDANMRTATLPFPVPRYYTSGINTPLSIILFRSLCRCSRCSLCITHYRVRSAQAKNGLWLRVVAVLILAWFTEHCRFVGIVTCRCGSLPRSAAAVRRRVRCTPNHLVPPASLYS